jgi:hypothetical protein
MQLCNALKIPSIRESLIKAYNGKLFYTIYMDHNGKQKMVRFDGLTILGADKAMAYGQLRPPFNVCVAGHYFSRHKIRLQFPTFPMVIERTTGVDRYYPLELLIPVALEVPIPVAETTEENPYDEIATVKAEESSAEEDSSDDDWLPRIPSDSSSDSDTSPSTSHLRIPRHNNNDVNPTVCSGPSPTFIWSRGCKAMNIWRKKEDGQWYRELIWIEK